jgi:DNA-binding transcriptional regulator YiaG
VWPRSADCRVHPRAASTIGLSPEDFASALGFSGDDARITVWRWETGRRKPSAQTVVLMKQLADLER